MRFMHWGILMLLVLVMPFFLGMFPASYMKKQHRTPAMVYLCGWFVSFSVFELVSIPFILLEKRFSLLVVVFSIVIGIVTLLCIVGGRFCIKELWGQYCPTALMKSVGQALREKKSIQQIFVIVGWLFFALLLAFQIYMALAYEYYDGDDAYYLAVSTLTDTFDTMYLRDCYTGYNYALDIRHAMSPVPIYLAWLSRLSGIHATIIAHSVLSVIWLVLMYIAYGEMSKCLFKREKQDRPLFLSLIAIWYLFGNITISTAETFAMTRIWQGKGLFAAVILPTLFFCFCMLIQKQVTAGVWMLLVGVAISSVFATSVSFMLIPTVIGLASIFIGIYKRSWRVIIQIFLTCLPCLLLAVCFLLKY